MVCIWVLCNCDQMFQLLLQRYIVCIEKSKFIRRNQYIQEVNVTN